MTTELIEAAKAAAPLLRKAGAFLYNHSAAHEKLFEAADTIDAAITQAEHDAGPEPVNTELLAAAEDYVWKTDDPVTYHPSPRCGCGDCGVKTYERLLIAIANAKGDEFTSLHEVTKRSEGTKKGKIE